MSKIKENKKYKEKIEDFFYSDTPSATATKFLLMFLALGSFAFGGAVIPSILKAIKGFDFSNNEAEKKYTKKQLNNALGNLKRQKLIKVIKEKNGKFKIKLTNKGSKRILKLSLENVSVQKPKTWDKKWRVVIFDVPTEFNSAREALRNKMKDLGFKQLQKSVWVYPYDCEDEILFVAEVFNVEKYVEIITAEKVLHEKVLKNAFKI
ncbi:CRISPR-associated endoribonuclease Cas2 [bacterium BMS3Abin15]|nr:CRISPR-associated endoribonuclease Cas2 [bacterium BMS3Abin15]HDH07569.1 hypothetical protein [Candidatus Moranbacteria bacterium]HDZ85122.1 hypothetical protein [Candidatus Moranbacteria bacterium]